MYFLINIIIYYMLFYEKNILYNITDVGLFFYC